MTEKTSTRFPLLHHVVFRMSCRYSYSCVLCHLGNVVCVKPIRPRTCQVAKSATPHIPKSDVVCEIAVRLNCVSSCGLLDESSPSVSNSSDDPHESKCCVERRVVVALGGLWKIDERIQGNFMRFH